MLSTPNGCTCHHLQGTKCISCKGRELKASEGHRCRCCSTGIYEDERLHGLCLECSDSEGGVW